MAEDKRQELISRTREEQTKGKELSDAVLIEIVHAFKEIILEFIDKRYQVHTED